MTDNYNISVFTKLIKIVELYCRFITNLISYKLIIILLKSNYFYVVSNVYIQAKSLNKKLYNRYHKKLSITFVV